MASNTATPRIIELAALISTSVTQLQEQLSAQGAPTPSFDEDGVELLPKDVSHLKDAVLDATAELHEILLDPILLLFKFASINNMVGIDAVTRYQIPDMVPATGQITFDEIAEKTGLQKNAVRRILRHAMSMRIFREPEPEVVAHSKISKFLTIPYINAWAQFESRDTWPATTRMVDAMQKWPNSEQMDETGFALANNGKTVPEVLTSDPERAVRFASAMQALDHVPGCAIKDISSTYDWASLGNAYVVNAMGSRGQAAIELAKNFPKLKLLVQDSAHVVQNASADVPGDLQGRIEFEAHELFQPQTVKADVYFFRMVFRNFGDSFAVQALRAQIPVMRPEVKILIQDAVMSEPNAIPLWRDRISRSVDLALECFANGRERYLDEWKALLAAADERFILSHVYVPQNSLLGIIEVHWNESGVRET